jgi:xanthine/uracil permease
LQIADFRLQILAGGNWFISELGNWLCNEFEQQNVEMNRQILTYAALILIILGLIGFISETAPLWSRYATLGLGLVLLLLSFIGKSGK